MRALILGIRGQDGSFLAENLLNRGYEVWGFVRRQAVPHQPNIEHIKDQINFVTGDMIDQGSLEMALRASRPDEIYNLAAQSFVGSSWATAAYTMAVDANGVIKLFEAVRSVGGNPRIYQACHDIETRIMTPSGIKTYSDICAGDLVYTFNTQTGEMETCPVRRVLVYNYEGDMIKLSGRRLSQLITPNHRVLLLKDDNTYGYHEASSVRSLLKYDRRSNISLPTVLDHHKYSPDIIDFTHYIDDTKSPNTHKNTFTSMKTSVFFYLLGLYIGDGYTQKDGHAFVSYSRLDVPAGHRATNGTFIKVGPEQKTIERNYPSNYIQFAVPRKDKARKELIGVLREVGASFKEHDNTVEFSSYALARMFKLSGKDVYSKRLPAFVWIWDDECLQRLFEGLIDSDGSWRNSKRRAIFTTVSPLLASDFMVLCARLGRFCSFTIVPEGHETILKDGRHIRSTRPAWVITVNQKTRNKVYRHNISTEKYSGKVWCLEIDGNPNFMVTRGGKVFFSGNSSSEMFGATGIPGVKMAENYPMLPASPYGIAKLAAHHACRVYRESYGMHISSGILMNHESTRRGQEFVTRKITRGLARISAGLDKTPLQLGNLESVRDWGYAPEYCIPLDVPILTPDGWKFFGDVNTGDEIINFNTASGTLKHDVILEKIRIKTSGRYILLRGRGVFLRVTPEHRIYYQQKSVTSKGGWSSWKVSSASEFVDKMNCSLRSRYNYRLPPFLYSDIPDMKDVSDPQLYLIGAILAEGCLHKVPAGRGIEVSLSQSFIANESTYEKIKTVLENLSLKYNERVDNVGCSTFTLNADSSRMVLSWFDVQNVHIMPRWMYNISQKQANIVFGAMMDCDGHWGSMTYASKRPLLAADFQTIAHLAGYLTSRCRPRGGINTEIWEVGVVSKRKNYQYVTEASVIDDEHGESWCVTTKNGTIITRDNGCIQISGNCEAMRLMLLQDKPDDYVIATGSPHSVREFCQAALDYFNLDQDVIQVTPAEKRPYDVTWLCGDYGKAYSKLRWEPKTFMPGLVQIMCKHDKELAAREDR